MPCRGRREIPEQVGNDGKKGGGRYLSPPLLFSYIILNLLCGVTSATSGSLTYTYLSDGTKVSAIQSDGSGKRYVGSMVYSVPASGSGSDVALPFGILEQFRRSVP